MKFTQSTSDVKSIKLHNDHYVAINYDCSDITANSSGIIVAGTIIPANDGTAIGVLMEDVKKAENPNGTLIVHGFIKQGSLATAPDTTAVTALAGRGVIFIDDGVPQ